MRQKTKAQLTLIVFMFTSLFIVYDLCAKERKTELELNQDIYRFMKLNEIEKDDFDYIGNSLIMKPVEKIKSNTESYLLNNMGSITHDDMRKNYSKSTSMFKNKSDGPKISLTF